MSDVSSRPGQITRHFLMTGQTAAKLPPLSLKASHAGAAFGCFLTPDFELLQKAEKTVERVLCVAQQLVLPSGSQRNRD